MAFLPEIHVNLEQLAFERIYQLFLPLIPGSTLVGGLMLAKPASVFAVTSALGLGRYSRFAAPLCVVYIVGFVLFGFCIWMVRFVQRSARLRPSKLCGGSQGSLDDFYVLPGHGLGAALFVLKNSVAGTLVSSSSVHRSHFLRYYTYLWKLFLLLEI